MRISSFEQKSIRETFYFVFGAGKIFLFGSRIDDTLKGGDIDLYLVPENRNNLYEKKIRFLLELDTKIGEQKIDVVFEQDVDRSIELEAIKTGILL